MHWKLLAIFLFWTFRVWRMVIRQHHTSPIILTIFHFITLFTFTLSLIWQEFSQFCHSRIEGSIQVGIQSILSICSVICIKFFLFSLFFDNLNNIRNLPRALIGGIIIVTIAYVLTNISYFIILEPHEILHSPAIAMVITESS